jgi:hypothetical protein
MSTPGAPPTSPQDPVFEQLRRAFASGDLTLFVGAGISSAAGLPGWKALVETVVATVRSRGADALRLEEIHELLQRGQLIDALTAAKEALGSPVQFCNLVEQQLDDTRRDVPDVGAAIAELSPGLRAVLTTNLDRLLERALQGRWPALVRPTGDLAQQRHYILHLHGTLRERDSWVMTREDYDRAMYANPQLQGMFSTLFHAHPLLFLGFGLADDNFDAVFARVRALAGRHPPQHFALVASETVTPSRRKRLEDSGLNLIVYANPDGRHSEVARLLRQLATGAGPGPGPGTPGGGAVTASTATPGPGQPPPSGTTPKALSGGLRPGLWVPLALGAVLLTAAVLRMNVAPDRAVPSTPEPGPRPAPVQAEQRFAGLVMDARSRPLPGVDVSLPQLGLGVQTDTFGRFQFSGAYAEGTDVRLSARKAGYRDYAAHGTWGDTGFNFALSKESGE